MDQLKQVPFESSWASIIPVIEPFVYQVHSGDGLGTAFIVATSSSEVGPFFTMFATAWHVVEDVVETNKILELVRRDGTKLSKIMVGPAKIYPLGPKECDVALIQVQTTEPLTSIDNLLPMPIETMISRGTDVGWLGFPGLVFPELCFFSGVVSGYKENPLVYLIDGVAINGVSGGPAFDRTGLLTGLVSAYLPNRLNENTVLPGLMILIPINLIRFWMEKFLKATVKLRNP
jgi:hypothetical protein